MFCEMIDDAFLVSMSGTSEGTQIKYYKDGYWYKKDSFGGEAGTRAARTRLSCGTPSEHLSCGGSRGGVTCAPAGQGGGQMGWRLRNGWRLLMRWPAEVAAGLCRRRSAG